MPVVTIPRLLLGLLSLLILAAAAYLLQDWWRGQDLRFSDGLVRHVRGARWEVILGAGLLAWSFLGRFVVLRCFAPGKDEPREDRGEARIVHAPDGSPSTSRASAEPMDPPSCSPTAGVSIRPPGAAPAVISPRGIAW